MKRDRIIYISTTSIIALLMFASAMNFAFNPGQKAAFSHFGLPDWFRIELTVAKFAGVAALIGPGVPRPARVFAYVGFAIVIVSADVAHLSSGDPAWFVIPHLTFLVILAVSYLTFARLGRARLSGAATA
jgi:hypothetical protein